MKELKDYTDEEIIAECARRVSQRNAAERLAQDQCSHEAITHISLDEEVSDHSGLSTVVFEFDKHCKKCNKWLETVRLATYNWNDHMEFKTALEELCRKHGKVIAR